MVGNPKRYAIPQQMVGSQARLTVIRLQNYVYLSDSLALRIFLWLTLKLARNTAAPRTKVNPINRHGSFDEILPEVNFQAASSGVFLDIPRNCSSKATAIIQLSGLMYDILQSYGTFLGSDCC